MRVTCRDVFVGIVLGLLWSILQPGVGRAQAGSPAAWTLHVDGAKTAWPGAGDLPADSLGAAARAALAALHADGHLLATVDSAAVDTVAGRPRVALYLSRGAAVHVRAVRLDGVTAFDPAGLLASFDTRPGRRFDPVRLERDLDALLARYDAAGYGLAAVYLEAVDVEATDRDRATAALRLRIDEGRPLRLGRVELPAGVRTRAGYAARLAGLRPGDRIASYDPIAVQRRLEASGHFRRVGTPRLLAVGDTVAIVRLDVEESAPGTFDLLLGYQPSPGGGGRFVGNGHLVLRNLFGAGRLLALRLDQLPGQVSAIDARVRDPYVLGRPISASLRFEGLQQDSSFTRQRYSAEVGYHLFDDLEVFGTLAQEATRPGLAGARAVGGRQRVARADALFTGFGFRYEALDAPLAPARGLFVEVRVESGRTTRSVRVDTVATRTALRQERLHGTARLYVPTFRRQTAVLGADVAALTSTSYDVSDLFRFGGATSLRGYDEDAFRGRLVARALTEYRYRLDRSSFAYVFFDLGYVDRPALGETAAFRRFLPGYGLGTLFETPLGLVNASYGLSRQGGRLAGRVHVGLSVGL